MNIEILRNQLLKSHLEWQIANQDMIQKYTELFRQEHDRYGWTCVFSMFPFIFLLLLSIYRKWDGHDEWTPGILFGCAGIIVLGLATIINFTVVPTYTLSF